MINNARYILLIAFAAGSFMLRGQEFNQKTIDPKNDKEILLGYCDRAGLEEGEFGMAFRDYYKIYEPDKQVIAQLRKEMSGIHIMIILGTWCSDSREQVPRFFKVLDKIRFETDSIEMICVDRGKTAGSIDVAPYFVQFVPTFIIMKNHKEIGRIVETPYISLEKDLLMFFGD